MANMKYFSGTIEVKSPRSISNTDFARNFGQVIGIRYDGYSRWIGFAESNGEGKREITMLPVTRIIEFKKNPSLHKCDARCMNARGHSCECSCGGKNHGASR